MKAMILGPLSMLVLAITVVPRVNAEISTVVSQTSSSIQAEPLQSRDRSPAFVAVPRLLRAVTSQKGTSIPSTYEFTLQIPADSGAPLKAIRIVQLNNVEAVKFDIGRSVAFIGEQLTADSMIPLARIGGEAEHPGEVTLVFDQPVQPGRTVTIALETNANPTWEGVYLFGITAFPGNEQGMSQFLGYGRIHIYSSH